MLVATLAGSAQDRPTEFQSWNQVQLIYPLVRSTDSEGKTVNKVTGIFDTIARFDGDTGINDARAGFELQFRANHFLTFVTSALYRGDEVTKHQRRYETRLAAGATFSGVWKEVIFRNRNLYEYRLRSARNDISVYRNRTQVTFPLKHNDKTLFSPFVSEEFFYDMSANSVNNNELYIGITRRFNPRTELDIAYIRNDTNPVNANGLSLALRITLR